MSDKTTKSDPKYSMRGLTIVGLLTVALLVGGVGRWFATAEISGAVIATGTIKVQQNRQIIQHPDGGVVNEILVTEGTMVNADSVLLRLDSSELTTELQIVESQLAELLSRKGRLEAERDNAETLRFTPLLAELRLNRTDIDELVVGQERLFTARRQNLETRKSQLGKRIEQIRSQIEGIEAQHASVGDQIDLIGQELASQQILLKQGVAQAARVLALQREEARLRGSAGQFVADISRARGQITELELEITNLDSRISEEAITALRDIGVQLLQLTERRTQLKQRLDRLDVRAPVAGIVYDLSVFARKAVIRPAEPLMYLIPQDQPLTIEVKVLPADIEQIHFGQSVNLKFSSFSQRTTPDLFGTVKTISADAFTDERSGLQFFVVEIALVDGELSKLPEGAQLLPGMPVDAFVETVARTPLDYLIQPFKDSIDRAFRES